MFPWKHRQLKFSLQYDKDFNARIYVDKFYIKGKPVFHEGHEAKRFLATRWLRKVAIDAIRKTRQYCWIEIYLELPDTIAQDARIRFHG